jgi:uncharacterized protein YqfB (UPF0267 family)
MQRELTMERIIEHHLLYKDKERLKGNKIGPSEISSACARQIVLGRAPEAVAVAEDPTLRGISVMLAGTAIHEYFQEKVFRENGKIEIVEAEKYISSEFINGYIDGIIRFIDAETLALLEIKSVNQVKFDKMKASKAPMTEYVEQITLYEGEEGIHEGYIFVINRGLFERETAMSRALKPTDCINEDMFLVFKVTFNENLYNSLVDRAKGLMRTLADYREYGIIPEKPGMCTPNGFPCLWCRFKHYCWPGMYREIPIGELDPPTRTELTRLFADHMANRAKAKALNEKIEASEKALNKFFRDNGKKGFSSVFGEKYVIGTNGSLYIENISENRKHREERESLAISPELIIINRPAEKKTHKQLTLEESSVMVQNAPEAGQYGGATSVQENPPAKEEQQTGKVTAKKRGRPKKEKAAAVKTVKKPGACKKKGGKEKEKTEVPAGAAIPTEEEYINDIFSSLDF